MPTPDHVTNAGQKFCAWLFAVFMHGHDSVHNFPTCLTVPAHADRRQVQTRSRDRSDVDLKIAALLLRYDVTCDNTKAKDMAEGRTLSQLSERSVHSHLEAIRLSGWPLQGVTSTDVRQSSASTLLPRALFCQAHRCDTFCVCGVLSADR